MSGENLLAILLVILSDDKIAVIKKYGNIAGKIKVSQRDMPSMVSEEKALLKDKISERAIKDEKIVTDRKVFTFLTIIYCIMA